MVTGAHSQSKESSAEHLESASIQLLKDLDEYLCRGDFDGCLVHFANQYSKARETQRTSYLEYLLNEYLETEESDQVLTNLLASATEEAGSDEAGQKLGAAQAQLFSAGFGMHLWRVLLVQLKTEIEAGSGKAGNLQFLIESYMVTTFPLSEIANDTEASNSSMQITAFGIELQDFLAEFLSSFYIEDASDGRKHANQLLTLILGGLSKSEAGYSLDLQDKFLEKMHQRSQLALLRGETFQALIGHLGNCADLRDSTQNNAGYFWNEWSYTIHLHRSLWSLVLAYRQMPSDQLTDTLLESLQGALQDIIEQHKDRLGYCKEGSLAHALNQADEQVLSSTLQSLAAKVSSADDLLSSWEWIDALRSEEGTSDQSEPEKVRQNSEDQSVQALTEMLQRSHIEVNRLFSPPLSHSTPTTPPSFVPGDCPHPLQQPSKVGCRRTPAAVYEEAPGPKSPAVNLQHSSAAASEEEPLRGFARFLEGCRNAAYRFFQACTWVARAIYSLLRRTFRAAGRPQEGAAQHAAALSQQKMVVSTPKELLVKQGSYKQCQQEPSSVAPKKRNRMIAGGSQC